MKKPLIAPITNPARIATKIAAHAGKSCRAESTPIRSAEGGDRGEGEINLADQQHHHRGKRDDGDRDDLLYQIGQVLGGQKETASRELEVDRDDDQANEDGYLSQITPDESTYATDEPTNGPRR